MAKKNKNTSKSNSTLDKVLKRFEQSWNYAENNYHENWEENWKLYHNKRVNRRHGGAVETFVPLTNSSINTMVAALFNSDPKFTFVPNHPDQEKDTAVLSELISDFSRRDGWNQKNMVGGTQCFITGNAPFMYEWRVGETSEYIHKEFIPIRDFFCDPTATSPENWRYAGRRYFTTKKQLKKETIIDGETGELKKRFKNIDEIPEGGSAEGDLSDKQIKDQEIGSLLSGSKQVEVIEYWDFDKVVSVAARSVVIEDRENPLREKARQNYESKKAEWEMRRALEAEPKPDEDPESPTYGMLVAGKDIGEFSDEFNEDDGKLIPFSLMRDYIDPSLIYGSSDVDILKQQQELLNDLTELNIEAILYQLYPEKTLDPKYSTYVDDLDPEVGKVYTLPQGAMTWNSPPVIPQNAFSERQNIKEEMRESVAVDQMVKGVASAQSQTATEIKALLAQAGQRVEMKANILENDFFLQEANICLKLIRLYITDSVWVRTMGDTGTEFEEYDPNKFLGEYSPMVQLDITQELERDKKRQSAIQTFQMVIQDPTNNLEEAKRILYPKMTDLTDEEVQSIITPKTPEIPPQGELGADGGRQVPPEIQGGVPEDIPPEVLQQIMQGQAAPPLEQAMPALDALGGMQ